MTTLVSQSELSRALSIVSRAADAGRQHPITANVKLWGVFESLTVTAFDLEIGIERVITAQCTNMANLSITVPARLFSDIISKLPSDQAISLSVEGTSLTISSMAGSYTIAGIAAEDFPDLPTIGNDQATRIPGPALAQSIAATIFAASNDEAKQLLCGVNFTITGQIEAAATNGHRLARSIAPLNELAPGFKQQACIPTRALRELARIVGEGDVVMHIGDAYLSASVADTTLYSRVLNGTYPDYEKLLPTVFEHGITVSRKALLDSLRRVALVADTHNSVVKFTADAAVGQLVISAETEAGSALEQMAATVIGSPMAAFNAGYLLDGLTAMHSDEVCLQLNSPTTPVILSPVGAEDSYTYLVMPVQVRQEAGK